MDASTRHVLTPVWRTRLGPEAEEHPFLYCTQEELRPYSVDCSLGVNPLGMPPEVAARLAEPSGGDLAPYPREEGALKEDLAAFWGGAFRPDQVFLGCGSMAVLLSLLRVLARPGGAMRGMAPQFPDFALHARFGGLETRHVDLKGPDYLLDPEALGAALEPDLSLVYLDRPHNPTGQVLSLEEVDRLADRCAAGGILLLVDEAYGEFLPEEASALHLDRPNLVVVRSFSKGWGLAGLRVGYGVVRDPELREILSWVHLPFGVSVPGVDLVRRALTARGFPSRSRREVEDLKGQVLRILGQVPGLHVAATDPQVPILLGVAEDPEEDLYETLLARGIRTESGRAYPGLGPRGARLRVPRREDLERFRACLAPSGGAEDDRAQKVIE